MLPKTLQHIVLTGVFILAGSLCMNAQTKTSTQSDPGTFPEVSFKKSKIAESPLTRGEDVLWKREVLRMVDLQTGNNAALYYPIDPTPDRKNLFCTLFDLIANGQLKAYEYLDGREIFVDDLAIKFKDILTKFEIPFREKPDLRKANSSVFEIDPIDIPSRDVTQFYVKEVYYLDQSNSNMRIKVMAICPILVKADETGEIRTYPMFWIPFETVKGYLSQISVSADTLNSVNRLNAYDFFNQRRYKGEIQKVSNLRNQSLFDYCKTPEELKLEQARLEKELQSMDETLWEPSQREMREAEKQAADDKNAQKKKKSTYGKASVTKSKNTSKTAGQEKPADPVAKPESAQEPSADSPKNP